MDADDGGVRVDPDLEAGGDHEVVVVHEGVDVIHVRHALDDGLQRLGGQLDGVGGAESRRLHHDVDHGNADLRLLLPRDGGHGQQAHRKGGDQEQGREGRAEAETGQGPG